MALLVPAVLQAWQGKNTNVFFPKCQIKRKKPQKSGISVINHLIGASEIRCDGLKPAFEAKLEDAQPTTVSQIAMILISIMHINMEVPLCPSCSQQSHPN